MTRAYDPYQIATNANDDVSTYGGAIGVVYYFYRGLAAEANYTYAVMDTSGLTDPIIPGFNTPRHKLNIGFKGTRIYKELGFSANFKWVDKFRWESSFGDGDVASYYLLDVQLNYNFPKLYSTLRIGGSNLLDNQHVEAYGSPTIGRLIYAAWSFNFDDFK